MNAYTDTISPAVLRPEEACKYVGISKSYLYLMVERGELPLLKLGGRASGIMRSDLDAWLLKLRDEASAQIAADRATGAKP